MDSILSDLELDLVVGGGDDKKASPPPKTEKADDKKKPEPKPEPKPEKRPVDPGWSVEVGVEAKHSFGGGKPSDTYVGVFAGVTF